MTDNPDSSDHQPTPVQLDAVAEILVRSSALGFLGSMPIDDQVTHALGFCDAIEQQLGRPPESFLDLGTGGGLPGLVLAAAWPASLAVLFDANERRTEFLSAEVEGWERVVPVTVVRGRAEEAGRDPALVASFEVVVARSFGAPAVTAECSAPFLATGGIIVVSEPPDTNQGERWQVEGLGELGLRPAGSFRFRDRFSYQILEKIAETPERYPRRVGIPAKRPLF